METERKVVREENIKKTKNNWIIRVIVVLAAIVCIYFLNGAYKCNKIKSCFEGVEYRGYQDLLIVQRSINCL